MGFSVEFAQRIFMFITLRVRNFFWYFKAFHRRQNSSAAFLVNDYTKFNLYKIIKIIKLSFLHQSTWTYKWLVKWDYRIYIFLSWLILTSQNWKEIVEKTFVRYLERKIARTLKTPFDTMKAILLANQSHRNRLKMKVSNNWTNSKVHVTFLETRACRS